MPVSTECAAALLSFRYPSLILKYGEGFRLIKNKQESEISRSNVLPGLNHAIVTFLRADFRDKISCVSATRRLRDSGSIVFHAQKRRKPATDDSKSWLEILDKSWAWLEILTRNSDSKEERMCSFSLARDTNSRSTLKIGQPSCAWYIFTKLYLVSILYFNRWINEVINTKLLVSSGIRWRHHQTISSPKESPSRIIYLYTYRKGKSLKENC